MSNCFILVQNLFNKHQNQSINMKKVAFLLLLIASSVQAQNGLDVGALAGINYAHYEYVGDEEVFAEYESGLGYYVGAFISFPVAPKISLAPELLYARQTAKAEATGELGGLISAFLSDPEAEAREDLLLLPIMFRMKLLKFDVALGPQLGYSLSRNVEVISDGATIELDDEIMAELFDYDNDTSDKLSVNLNIDAGYYITKHLKIGARYSYGLLLRDEVRTSVWQLGLSYGIL